MGQVTVGRWGNNLALRLPGEIVQAIGLHDGERVDVSTEDGTIVVRRVQQQVTLEALFRGRTSSEWRSAYAAAYDWGPDRGREIVPE